MPIPHTFKLVDLTKFTESGLKKRLYGLESRLLDIARFYPWPALVDSYKEDIKVVQVEQQRRAQERKDYGTLLRQGR